jgi:hypothetical protein
MYRDGRTSRTATVETCTTVLHRESRYGIGRPRVLPANLLLRLRGFRLEGGLGHADRPASRDPRPPSVRTFDASCRRGVSWNQPTRIVEEPSADVTAGW